VKNSIEEFINQKLKLTLHPRKSFIHKASDGVCFVGYRVFHDHTLIRGKTLLRMQKKYSKKVKKYREGKLSIEKLKQTESSIKGHLIHANAYALKKKLFEK